MIAAEQGQCADQESLANSSKLRLFGTCFLKLNGSAMLQELSHMDRITQLQDEIQQVMQLL